MTDKSKSEIKWNDKNLLWRTAIIWFVFNALFWAIGETVKPSEGHAFKRLPAVTGVYECCDSLGRSTRSSVDGVAAICGNYSHFPFGGSGWSDCGFKEHLKGRVVTLERVAIPYYLPEASVAVGISESGKKYLEISDAQLRIKFIEATRVGGISFALVITVFFHACQFIYLDRTVNKSHRATI